MKIYLIIIFTIFPSLSLFATKQEPDYLIYNNKKSELYTTYEWNSLLQNIIYFPMASTANYRGHIATYSINNNELFLLKIVIPEYDKKTNPTAFRR